MFSYSKLIIGGDFNIDMLKNNLNKSNLLDLFSSYGLKRCIKNKATRILCPTTSTLIDNIFIFDPDSCKTNLINDYIYV